MTNVTFKMSDLSGFGFDSTLEFCYNKDTREKQKQQRKEEKMNKNGTRAFTFAEAGMVVGDTATLVNETAIAFAVTHVGDPSDVRDPDRVDVLVLGETVVFDESLRKATDTAKRIAEPEYSKNTDFHAPLEWVTSEGVRLTDIIEGRLKAGEVSAHGATGLDGRGQASQVTLNLCETCFLELPSTGVCFWCE